MKGIPSLSERYAAALEHVKACYKQLEDTQTTLDKVANTREQASVYYNTAMNELQTILLLKDIQEGNITVHNAHTGQRINVAFI